MKNEFKLLFTVKQSKHNGLWLITVEGVCVASAETEDKAWDWVENTWSKFPMDSVKEIREQIEMQPDSQSLGGHRLRGCACFPAHFRIGERRLARGAAREGLQMSLPVVDGKCIVTFCDVEIMVGYEVLPEDRDTGLPEEFVPTFALVNGINISSIIDQTKSGWDDIADEVAKSVKRSARDTFDEPERDL